MKLQVLLSLLVTASISHAQENTPPLTLEEAAKLYKPTYRTNFSTDMSAFMQNSPIFNGLGFVYVNPNGVSPKITESVVFHTNTVKVPVTTTTIVDVPYTYTVPVTTTTTVTVPYTYTVPVTTTWTTTSVVRTEVVTPYSVTNSTASYALTSGWASSSVSTVADVTNSILANSAQLTPSESQKIFGGDYANYWVIHGAPTSAEDVKAALASSGTKAPWDNGVIDISGWTTTGVRNANTTTVISNPADYVDGSGVLHRGRTITTTTYNAVEDRTKTSVAFWQDTNSNGLVDDTDTVYVYTNDQMLMTGDATRTDVTEAGERVTYRDDLVTETHSETHMEERTGTREETVTETHDEERTGVRQEERTETHEEERTETTQEVVRNKKNTWKFSFSPILSLDIQTPTKITSLDSQFVVPTVSQGTSRKFIEPASATKGFLVEKKMAVTGAIGGAVVAQYSAWKPGTALTLGMAPIAGTEKTYRTIVKTGYEAENVTVPAVPSSLSDLKKLKVGDTISFAQVGGVMFSAGAAYVALNVGVNYIAIGQWKTDIQKVNDSIYYVNRTAVKMNNFGASIGTTLTIAYSANQFKSTDSQFSWVFNAADPQGAKALENFVFKGIALDAQKLVNASGETAVLAVTKQDNIAHGALRTISMGVPYITTSWGKGRINQTQLTQYFPDNTLGDANYSVYLKARDSRMFNWIENSTVAFSAGRYNVRDVNTNELQDSGYMGQFIVSYTDTHTKGSELQRVVNQLVALTGMHKELYVEVPKMNNLGYGALSFQLTFDKSATDFLMALATDRSASRKLERDAQVFLNGYVRGNGFDRKNNWSSTDPIGMCGTIYDYNIDVCIGQAQEATLAATGEAIVNLRDMKAALERGDRRAFTTAYADFGKSLTASPFTFQAVLSAAVAGTAGKGVSASYNVSGTRIKNYSLTPSWDATLVNEINPLTK
ncbi:MAG: hypothetical protein OM95_02425 [Bdellovibrio sp. ArHS]|uniref:hypothetical protein n=1 Tax=Bdellovibrio sp. ArHS TaxID=1569284 RepID=UPI000582AFAD|nr:hypothetical protein [Bdellovibrio sp. ArHS]KHD89605.1 MAG: hypothetical protein OM95_02425 [Bdellovibrio sp. ArHS]